MKRMYDEYGRELAWLEQLEPDYDGPPDDEYDAPNIFVTLFLEPGETPPTDGDFYEGGFHQEDITWTRKEPNCVTSWCPDEKMHRLVLDLDFECRLVPSSSPGCYHLYLDGLALDPRAAYQLTRAMTRVGMIEKGFAQNLTKDGKVCVRATNVKKKQPKPAKGEGRKVSRLRTAWEPNDNA